MALVLSQGRSLGLRMGLKMGLALALGLSATGLLALAINAPEAGAQESQESQDSDAPNTSEAAFTTSEYSANQTIGGVAFGDLRMGDPQAPVTMIEYASLTCPHCARFHSVVLPEIETLYIATGRVRLIFRNFILNQYDLYAAMIARCMGPGKIYAFQQQLFRTQPEWLDGNIIGNLARMAEDAGMDRESFDTCLTNDDLKNHLVGMQAYGNEQLDVTGTPTVFINGEKISGVQTIEIFAAAIGDE
jgi:protein-disulfide isomerase